VKLNRNEFKNKLLLATDKHGYTVWHRVGEEGSLEVLEILWSWAKEAGINPEDLLLV